MCAWVPLMFLLAVLLQVVPRASVGQRSREAADGEGQERQLPGEGEPEPAGRLRPVRPDRRRQDGQQRRQTQGHSRHDPLPGEHRLRLGSVRMNRRLMGRPVGGFQEGGLCELRGTSCEGRPVGSVVVFQAG